MLAPLLLLLRLQLLQLQLQLLLGGLGLHQLLLNVAVGAVRLHRPRRTSLKTGVIPTTTKRWFTLIKVSPNV